MKETLAGLWEWWKRVARRIGEVQSAIVLTMLYLVLFAPLTLIVRAKDPLALRSRGGWRPYHGRSDDLEAARRQ